MGKQYHSAHASWSQDTGLNARHKGHLIPGHACNNITAYLSDSLLARSIPATQELMQHDMGPASAHRYLSSTHNIIAKEVASTPSKAAHPQRQKAFVGRSLARHGQLKKQGGESHDCPLYAGVHWEASYKEELDGFMCIAEEHARTQQDTKKPMQACH